MTLMTGFVARMVTYYIKSNRPEYVMTAIFEPRKQQPKFKNKEQNVLLIQKKTQVQEVDLIMGS